MERDFSPTALTRMKFQCDFSKAKLLHEDTLSSCVSLGAGSVAERAVNPLVLEVLLSPGRRVEMTARRGPTPRAPSSSVGLLQKLSPPLFKELSHVVSGPADVRVVLVELLAVVEHQVDVDDERFQVLILAADEFFTNGGKVHGLFNDFFVPRDRFEVDGSEERPGVLMPF